jgi:serine/threonine-protein kinase RsbW
MSQPGKVVGGRDRLPPGGNAVEIKMVLDLPREAASVPVSRQVMDGCLEKLGVTPDTRTDIALALSEACANVVLHAAQTDEYEVLARVTNGRCVIEVVNKGGSGALAVPAARRAALADGMVPVTAEHGRGLKIMDAVVDNLQLTGGRDGTTVHFEKDLDWVPGAAGELLYASEQ